MGLAPLMKGKFYYSKKMRKWLDDKGHPRFFCIIEGDIKEYTEMVDENTLNSEPEPEALFDDIIFIGMGHFSHTVRQ